MQELIKRFLDEGLSRRGLIKKLGALGIGISQARSLLEAFQASEAAGQGLPVPGSTTVKGTGGELLMAQAKAAGAEYLFSNPGSFETGIFDAQITSGVPLIMGLHEGIVISLADGYHREAETGVCEIHVVAGTAQARASYTTPAATARQWWSPPDCSTTRSGATRVNWRRGPGTTRKKSHGSSRRSAGRRARPRVCR